MEHVRRSWGYRSGGLAGFLGNRDRRTADTNFALTMSRPGESDHPAGRRVWSLRIPADPRLLRDEGWRVNHKRVERIWRQEGLKVPQKQPKRGRLWLNDGSCLRLRPCWPNHVWSYDFVADRTHDGRALKMLTIVDEYTRECLAIHVGRRLCSIDLVELLFDLFVSRGLPDYIRSDNGSEFTAQVVREWLQRIGVKTLFIEPGSPWENGYCRVVQREVSGRMP